METRRTFCFGGIALQELGNTKLVSMYFDFLVKDYHMNFLAQVLPNTVGVETPTYIYSYYNQSGCFSLVEISQRKEWDCYVARQFAQQASMLLSTKINQTNYIKRTIYTTRAYLKLTANSIQSQINLTNSFWGIQVGRRDGLLSPP